MKYIIAILSLFLLSFVFIFCGLTNKKEMQVQPQYLRIHIRANSNSIEDQNVKYKVKEGVVDALTPLLAEIETFEEAKIVMENNFDLIEKVANSVLKEEDFSYTCQAEINNEYFPTRTYEHLTLKEGFYDALILKLGSGKGDNWWCIVYPAFCFTSTSNENNVVYVSKIWQLLQKWF